MKDIVELFVHKKIIFKKFIQIPINKLASRKKIDIYLGTNLKNYYCAVFNITKTSRILQKEVLEFMELHKKLELYNDSKINIKYIIINAPLCSKAKALLEDNGWRVWNEEI